MIKAVINVEAARPQVFTILSDYAKYREWLPGCESSTVVAVNGASSDAEIVINSMKKMTLGLRFEAVPDQVLNFKMYSGKDINAYSGSYRLMDSASAQGTVIIAELEIDAGPMAPKFIVDRMAKKAIEDTGAALRKYLETLPAQARAKPPAGPRTVQAKPLRTRRLLQVVKTADGHLVWWMGKTFTVRPAD